MISSEVLSLTYGLCSAVSWGAGDFSGGLATKKTNVLSVILIAQLVGAVFLVALAFWFHESLPSIQFLVKGGLAGIFGALGLVALYKGLSTGRMGIVAPLSAVVTAVVPVLFAAFFQRMPDPMQSAGFVMALAAVWLLSRSKTGSGIKSHELYLPLLAGLGFGFFFIFIDMVSQAAVFWPLVSARAASISMMWILLYISRKPGRIIPAGRRLPLIVLAGIFDAGGNAFFALATQVGRLDVSAVLASFYPGITVVLSWIVLKERMKAGQWAGVVMAICAFLMISS